MFEKDFEPTDGSYPPDCNPLGKCEDGAACGKWDTKTSTGADATVLVYDPTGLQQRVYALCGRCAGDLTVQGFVDGKTEYIWVAITDPRIRLNWEPGMLRPRPVSVGGGTVS